MTAVATTLAGITFTAAETAAAQVLPSVVSPTSMVSVLINEINEYVVKLNQLAAVVPAGANLTALQAVVTKLTT